MRIIKLAIVAVVLLVAWQWWSTRDPGGVADGQTEITRELCQGMDAASEDCSRRIAAVEVVCSTLEDHRDKTSVAAEIYRDARTAAIKRLGGEAGDEGAGLGHLIVATAVNHACPELDPDPTTTTTG